MEDIHTYNFAFHLIKGAINVHLYMNVGGSLYT